MTKELLVNGLNNIRSNCLFGLIATRVMSDQMWKEIAESSALFKGPSDEAIRVALAPLAKRILDPTTRPGCVKNTETSHIRTLVRVVTPLSGRAMKW